MLDLPPQALASAGVTTLRQVYGVTLEYSLSSLAQLDHLFVEQFRVGNYTPETYPAMLGLTIGAYMGEVLLRVVDGGHWGNPEENLFGTTLPFLLYSRPAQDRQINVVDYFLYLLWSGDGIPPRAYLQQQIDQLTRLGFPRK